MRQIELNQVLTKHIYAVLLISCLVGQNIYAENRLLRIRAHLYEVDNLPACVRLALDFSEKVEELELQVPLEITKGIPDEYKSEFVVSVKNVSSRRVIQSAEIEYGNTEGVIYICIQDHEIHVAVRKQYKLNSSFFGYIPENRVAYVDLEVIVPGVAPLTRISEPSPEMKQDTVIVKKVIHDTVFVPKTEHDTTLRERVILVEAPKERRRLTEINCEHFVHWWSDPHYKLDFNFNGDPERLIIKEIDADLPIVEGDYSAQYVIFAARKEAQLFDDRVKLNYVSCDDRISLKLKEGRCYIMAREGTILKPHEFCYDSQAGVAYVRIKYTKYE